MELWSCGAVELWSCGAVELWSCGAVELWSCGAVERYEVTWRNGLTMTAQLHSSRYRWFIELGRLFLIKLDRGS